MEWGFSRLFAPRGGGEQSLDGVQTPPVPKGFTYFKPVSTRAYSGRQIWPAKRKAS